MPDGTKSLALILDDPDAPDPKAPKRVWVHWVLYNLPPDARGLAENADKTGLPARHGARRQRLRGRRRMTVHARRSAGIAISTSSMRSTRRSISAQATKAELEAAMKGHVLAQPS